MLFDGPLGGWNRLEPLVGDRVAALDGQAVGAGGETLLRPLDRAELLGEPLAYSLRELVVVKRCRLVAEMLVCVGG